MDSAERYAYARKLAKLKIARLDSATVDRLGEANVLSDLEHEILLSLPAKVLRPKPQS